MLAAILPPQVAEDLCERNFPALLFFAFFPTRRPLRLEIAGPLRERRCRRHTCGGDRRNSQKKRAPEHGGVSNAQTVNLV